MTNVTKNNINTIINNPKLIVLFFNNPTCGPCEGVKISLSVAQKAYPNVLYCSVNTHADEEIPKRYGIRTTPALIFIKKNKEVGRLTGSITPAMIVSIIKSNS